MTLKVKLPSTKKVLRWFLAKCKSKPPLTMTEFSERDIVVAKGPFKNQRFRLSRQPFLRHWFTAIDSQKFPRHLLTGCTQSGKSLAGWIIPATYHLFQMNEGLILGTPTALIAMEKWKKDLEPIIKRSKYRNLMPLTGAGSRGGEFTSIDFRNGTSIKIMTGGGAGKLGDKSRAHYETRVAAITEIDGFDEGSDLSIETDPVSQIEARTLAHGIMQKRIYLECTLSTKKGRTYRELKAGTDSYIVCQCPYCKSWVTPEREHLKGWQDAETEKEAYLKSYFICPACAYPLTQNDRENMNLKCDIKHRNDPEKVLTFSMRWNAFNNRMWVPGDIGVEEWKKEQCEDERVKDDMERKLCQFYWSIPYESPEVNLTILDYKITNKRRGQTLKGEIPQWCDWITGGVDLHKRLGYYILLASRADDKGVICNYGKFEIAADDLGTDTATRIALKDFQEFLETGFPVVDSKERKMPLQVWFDSGFADSRQALYDFCHEFGTRYRPIKGYGGIKGRNYLSPQKIDKNTIFVGLQYYFKYLRSDGIALVEIDSDYWKTRSHEALTIPVLVDGEEQAGAIQLYSSPDKNEHITITKHFSAERKTKVEVPGKGEMIKWIQESRNNHFFDCLYISLCASNFCKIMIQNKQAGGREPVREPEPQDEYDFVKSFRDNIQNMGRFYNG